MRFRHFILYSLWALSIPITGLSQSSGFDLLVTGPGSRALGMNGTITAAPLGASSIYANPAQLSLEESSSLSAGYSLWIAGLRNSHFAASFKKGNSAIALGLLNSQGDDFELRNNPQPSQGTFSVSYLSMAGAYAYQAGNFSGGITAQYLREQFLINDASGYAFNVGLSSRWLSDRLTLSTTIRNLGKMDKLNQEATQLPTEWRVGAYAEFLLIDSPAGTDFPIDLMLGADYVHPLEDKDGDVGSNAIDSPSFITVSVGLTVAGTLNVYSGFRSEKTERPFAFGSSVNLDDIGIDYAFIPFDTGFGNAHSVGLTYRF